VRNREVERFVANGEQIIRTSDGYIRKIVAIQQEVAKKYAAEFTGASFLGKIALWWKMKLEIRQEIRQLTPPHALYLAKDGPS
jgi:hypothetical protein